MANKKQSGTKNKNTSVNKKAPAKKNSSSTAKSSGRQPANTKKKTQSNKSEKKNVVDSEVKRQRISIVLFGISAIFLAATLIKGEHIWLEVHKFFLALFGITAIVWPLMMIYIAFMIAAKSTFLTNKQNIIGVSLFTLILSGVLNVFSQIPEDANSIGEQIEYIWSVRDNMAMCSGGITGVIFGGIPYMLFGKTAAATVLIIILVVLFMLLTGTTLFGIGLFFKNIFDKAKNKRTQSKADTSEEDGYDDENNDDDEEFIRPPRRKFVPLTFPEDDSDGTIIIDELVGNQKKVPVNHNKKGPKPFINIETGEVVETESPESDMTSIADIISKVNKKDTDGSKKKKEEKEEKENKDTKNTSDSKNEPKKDEDEQVLFKTYKKPDTSCLLYAKESNPSGYEEELKYNATKLVDTLNSFGVSTKIVDICRGPSVTRYELQPAAGVKISRITSLSDDIALALASTGVRIEAPIPNKSAVGIEVPNKNRSTVSMREIVESPVFKNAKSKLNVALGKDITGNVICADIEKMPHLLIAGTTGSGKSVCLNSMIVSLLFNANPDEVKFVMIDPKKVEFTNYNGIPHLLVPVVSDPRKAAGALGWAVTEMLQRYISFSEAGVRDIKGYNKLAASDPTMTPLPHIVIFIDELSDLMMAAPNEVEDSICRLAQMARAAGMHLVIATQRPSVNVITGLIKANIPSRIALSVSSQIDSRTILDSAGAEKLLGNGDMLFCPMGLSKPVRVQGCFLSDEEVESVVDFIKQQGEEKTYDEEVIKEIDRQAVIESKKSKPNVSASDGGDDSGDEMLPKAIEVVVEAQIASTTLLQRKLKLGYARAARIIDELENRHIVGPFEGSKPRKVLISKQQWIEMNALGNASAPMENPLVTPESSDFDEDDEDE